MRKQAGDAPPRTLVQFEPTVKGMVVILLAIAVAWVLLRLAPVFLVLVAALFLAGTLNPAVTWLEARKWKRGWAIGCVFALMLLLMLAVLALTIPSLIAQIASLVQQEPAMRAFLVEHLERSRATLPLAKSLREFHYDALAKSSATAVLGYSSRLAETLAYLTSSVFLALYVMIDRDRLRGALFAAVPRTHHIRLARVLLNLETIVGGYIRGQALTSLCLAVFTFLLLTACGVTNALAFAVFAGLADVLPYIGVFLSVGPAVAAAIPRGVVVVVIVLSAMLAYEEFESRFLVPKIYGRALRLPSSVVLFALLAGGTLMGIVGALLALPVAAAIRMLIEELRVELPGEDAVDDSLRERDQRAELEYERRVDGVPAQQAAAIAVEISEERRQEEGGGIIPAAAPVDSGPR